MSRLTGASAPTDGSSERHAGGADHGGSRVVDSVLRLGRLATWVQAGRIAAYLAMSALVLYPVLASPVVADDFANPWVQTDAAGPGLWNGLRYGWDGATKGASFRIAGNLVGSGFNWFWVEASTRLDVSITTLYAITKFVVLVLTAQAAARVWFAASRAFGRGIRFGTASVAVSIVLFSSVQLHALWSNDPVGNYPLAGFGAVALGLLVIAGGVVAVERRTWRSFAVGCALALLSVLYYEANIGAVVGAGIVMAAAAWRHRAERPALVRLVTGGALVTGIPAAVVLYGRTVTGGNTDAYSGTTTNLRGAPRAVYVAISGSIPGSAWRLSQRMLGGRIAITFVAVAVVLLLVWVVRWWWCRTLPTIDLGTDDGEGVQAGSIDRLGLVSTVVACAVFAGFVIVLQSITEKVQREAPEVGYVYTAYAFSATVIALGLAVVATRFFASGRAPNLRFLVAILTMAFVLVQSNINWRLSERLNDVYVPSRRLLDSFDGDVDPARRCQALIDWRAVGWPAYYEDGVTNGMQEAYEEHFGQEFCDGVGADAG